MDSIPLSQWVLPKDIEIGLLTEASEAFYNNNIMDGCKIFERIQKEYTSQEHKVYEWVWIHSGCRKDVSVEYGRYSFHNIHDFNTTAQEKAKAIDACLIHEILTEAFKAFRKNDKLRGFALFNRIQQRYTSQEHKVYEWVWINSGRPKGVPIEYGRYCFYDIHGFSTTVQEKARAIEAYLMQQNYEKSIVPFGNKARFPQKRMEKEFQELEKNVFALQLSHLEPGLTVYKSIQQNIENLIQYTEDEIDLLTTQENEISKQLVCSHQEECQLYQTRRVCEQEIISAQTIKSALLIEKSDLCKLSSQTNDEIKLIERKLKENGEQSYLWQFLSWARGETQGQFDTLEQLHIREKEVSKSIESIYNRITYYIDRIEKINRTIDSLKFRCVELGETIKGSGKNLTALRKFNFNLKKLLSTYEFLTSDLECITILFTEGFLDADLVSDFAQNIYQIRRNLAIDHIEQ